MEIKIRKAKINDCKDVFNWRNDELTRKVSFSSDPVSYDDHLRWFNDSLSDPSRTIYIGENHNGNKIGVIRLDRRNKDVAEFNINIAPEMRGKGYGSRLIELACVSYSQEYGQCLFLARIKKDNLASFKTFKKAGFIELFEYNDKDLGPITVLSNGAGRE